LLGSLGTHQAVVFPHTIVLLFGRRNADFDIPRFDISMATPAEGDHIFQPVGLLWPFEATDSLDVVNVRVSSESVRGFPAVLAAVIVSFERLLPDSPPLASVLQRATFPLVVVLPDDVLR
jgi:hypothetical protein